MSTKRRRFECLNLSNWYLYYLAWVHLYPMALYHYYMKPFRRDIPRIGYVAPIKTVHLRRRDAFLDAFYDTVLKAYKEHTGLEILPTTGQMLTLFRDLMGAMDETIEDLLRSDALTDVSSVVRQPGLQGPQILFRSYLGLFERSEPVLSHVSAVLDRYLPTYFSDLTAARQKPGLDILLRTAYVEAGYIRLLMEMVALFNGHPIEDAVMQDFHAFGMVGRFADDLLDFSRDLERDDPNMLRALLAEHPGEAARVSAAIRQGQRMGARFWQTNCPLTYARFIELTGAYYDKIQSEALRYACHLAMAPGIVGYDYDAAKFRS